MTSRNFALRLSLRCGCLLCLVCGTGAFPSFQFHQIGTYGQKMGQTSLVDVDKDGDLDFISGKRDGNIYWWEYRGPDSWIQHLIGADAPTDVGGCAFDVDGDGWIDQVSGSAWYKNPGNPRSASQWQAFTTTAIRAHDDMAADINGDGRLDLVAHTNGSTWWYRVGSGAWPSVKIGGGIHGGVSPRGAGDIDGDGDVDVVRGDVWFENRDGAGGSWAERPLPAPPDGRRPDQYGLAYKVWVCDMNRDGRTDIVLAEADCADGRTYWYENAGGTWNFHAVSANSTNQDFHTLGVHDFDGDGDLDVFSGGGPLSSEPHKTIIWENLDGTGTRWKEHVALEGYRCHEGVAGDVDGDGDIDICSKPWNGTVHYYLRNMLAEGGATGVAELSRPFGRDARMPAQARRWPLPAPAGRSGRLGGVDCGGKTLTPWSSQRRSAVLPYGAR